MELSPLVVVVGSGGVGKTTLAAALGVNSARSGLDTLVMTFDPSLRLKDALGVGDEAKRGETRVPLEAEGKLDASLLDAKDTFDRLVARYAPDTKARDRILNNRYYSHLAGCLAGILEYMAVERLFEVAAEGRYGRVVLDTPPTRQALEFLDAPSRIVAFLDSGALRLALRPWFDETGRLKAGKHLGALGRTAEAFLDRVVGLDLLRDMAEFFQAFGPLYDGFRERAQKVQALLRSPETVFVLVSAPGAERVPDALFFARRLIDGGHRLGPIIVNRIHPRFPWKGAGKAKGPDAAGLEGERLLSWLGERDRRGVEELRSLLPANRPLVEIPLLPVEPVNLAELGELGALVAERLRECDVPFR